LAAFFFAGRRLAAFFAFFFGAMCTSETGKGLTTSLCTHHKVRNSL
jgi:hypothetical protein